MLLNASFKHQEHKINLSNNDIKIQEELKRLISLERKTLSQIIELLQKVYDTKLYAKLGHSSIVKYLVKEHGYSESAAYRRYCALRITREIPETKMMIASGSIGLTNLTHVQTMLKGKDTATKKEALFEIQNKTSEQTKRKLFDYAPEKQQQKTDQTRQVSKDSVELRVTLSNTIAQKIKLLKARTKTYDTETLIEKALDIALKETDLTQKGSRRSKESLRQRHISAEVKKKTLNRAQHRCEHPGCGEINFLEYDHIRPISQGGQSHEDNIRLVCRTHNQLYAQMMRS